MSNPTLRERLDEAPLRFDRFAQRVWCDGGRTEQELDEGCPTTIG